MKVLILDADWRFVQQATTYFEGHAHLVVHHTRADQALAKAKHWQPDLVIVSAEYAADATFINSLYSESPRPAVLLTEHMHRFDRAWRIWQRCGDELLMKPVFKAEELHQAVVAALENAASGAGARRTMAASA